MRFAIVQFSGSEASGVIRLACVHCGTLRNYRQLEDERLVEDLEDYKGQLRQCHTSVGLLNRSIYRYTC